MIGFGRLELIYDEKRLYDSSKILGYRGKSA
jgi:hypothetical protein